jgi:hypothetical protein
MELETYVSEILNKGLHATSFPADLDIPRTLVDYCWELYQDGEKIGKERGVNLFLDTHGKLDIDTNVFQGTPTGITITSATTNDNFGDLHCHPSNSVGHVNGYAAHSGEDFLAIRNNTAKPVFIRFVASGTHIYAAVYRSGYSTLVESQIASIRDTNSVDAQKFFEQKCLVKKTERDAAMLNMNSSQEMDQYMVQRRRETPGLGKEMQRLSINVCETISKQLKFGFYAGDQGYGISVWYYKYLRLNRRAP